MDVQFSLRKDSLQEEFVFLFEYNTGFGEKKQKIMVQVICPKCMPDINPLNGILRKSDCDCPGTYLSTFKNAQSQSQQ